MPEMNLRTFVRLQSVAAGLDIHLLQTAFKPLASRFLKALFKSSIMLQVILSYCLKLLANLI